MDREAEHDAVAIFPKPDGPSAWLNLKRNLLNDAGKAIVNGDPNLSDSTIAKLMQIAEPAAKGYITFDLDDEDSIGFTTISMCISENPNATMAELVARYSETREIPFAIAASALNEIRKKGSFFFYARLHGGEAFKKVRWQPREVYLSAFVRPPEKRKRVS